LTDKIGRIKALFHWLVDREYVEPVKFGVDSKKPEKRQVRRHHREQAERILSPEEFLAVTNELGLQMRTATLLGLNCGFGLTDYYEFPK